MNFSAIITHFVNKCENMLKDIPSNKTNESPFDYIIDIRDDQPWEYKDEAQTSFLEQVNEIVIDINDEIGPYLIRWYM
jgi:hypothetical protein